MLLKNNNNEVFLSQVSRGRLGVKANMSHQQKEKHYNNMKGIDNSNISKGFKD